MNLIAKIRQHGLAGSARKGVGVVWIAGERLCLAEFGADDVYVDVAAASSPWAKALRERRGVNAFAIDLAPVGE